MSSVIENRQRLQYFDMAKGLGILMITYGHITSLSNPIDTWMSLFKISIFFVVGGALMSIKTPHLKYSISEYIGRLLRSLIWPYLVFSIIFMLATAFRGYVQQEDCTETLILYAYRTISLRGISTLWFLPVLFFGQMIAFFILKSRNIFLLVLGVSAPILIGLLAEHYLDLMADTLQEERYILISYPIIMAAKSIIAVWFLLIGFGGHILVKRYLKTRLMCASVGVVLSTLTVIISFKAEGIDLNMMHLGENPIYFFLGGVIGSFGAILVFRSLEGLWSSDLLLYFGRNSLILMTIQRSLFVIRIVEKGWISHFNLHTVVCRRYYLETLCILALVLVMSAGFIELINRKFPILMKLDLGLQREVGGAK